MGRIKKKTKKRWGLDAIFSLINVPTRVMHLLQLVSLYWCLIITPSPQVTLGSTLDDVHAKGLDVPWHRPPPRDPTEDFHCPNTLCAPPVHLYLPKTLATTNLSTHSVNHFAFKIWFFFFIAVLGSQQHKEEGTEISQVKSYLHTCTASQGLNVSPRTLQHKRVTGMTNITACIVENLI